MIPNDVYYKLGEYENDLPDPSVSVYTGIKAATAYCETT